MRRTPARRLAARIVTGAVGHFYGGLVDVAVYVAKRRWARVRRRMSAR